MICDSLRLEDTSYLMTPLDDDVQVIPDMSAPVTNEEITGIIKYLPVKSRKLDPIPTWLLKSSEVPVELKHAHIRPRLKKPSLHPELLSNNRPV